MTLADKDQSEANAKSVVLSIDAMGGDSGPAAVVAGLALFLKKEPTARALIFGRQSELTPLVLKKGIGTRVDIRNADDVIQMSDKPSQALRSGKNSSMWAAIEAVRNGEADVIVSCGNTGALMAMSMLRLRKAEGVNRPAIACLWPSFNTNGFNVVLDVGADIRADQDDLLTYALMGASYARNGMGLSRPRVGLLNVGVEEHKGRAELKVAHEMIGLVSDKGEFDYVGFVEGGDIPSKDVDVIVTDGFTGNVALKTGEGTANLIAGVLSDSFKATLFNRFAALLSLGAIKRLRRRVDPRRVNGGVFLGLNKTVVKSHGSADATGVSAAIALAYRLGKAGFSDRLAARVASAAALAQDATTENEVSPKSGTESGLKK